MAEIEVKGTENVMEACARTSSVRSCVLTSSLLACIWRDKSRSDLSTLVNHDCWSDEPFCIEKKVLPQFLLPYTRMNPSREDAPMWPSLGTWWTHSFCGGKGPQALGAQNNFLWCDLFCKRAGITCKI